MDQIFHMDINKITKVLSVGFKRRQTFWAYKQLWVAAGQSVNS